MRFYDFNHTFVIAGDNRATCAHQRTRLLRSCVGGGAGVEPGDRDPRWRGSASARGTGGTKNQAIGVGRRKQKPVKRLVFAF